MKYSSTIVTFLLAFLPWAAHALPVDLSIPAGGLGPTTVNGYAEHWLDLGDFDFGGGLSLPLRVNLNSGRQVEFVGFGKGSPFWRAPELHARVLDKEGDRRGVMLPCGKVLFLVKQAGGADQFATEDGEWNGSFHGLALVLSRADGWELEYNAAGWLSRLRTDSGRTLLWNRAANQNLLSITEQVSKTAPGGPRADTNGITGLVVKRDPATGAITGFDTHTPFGNKTYTLGYDDQQRLRSATFPNGQAELYSYAADKDGNPELTITERDLVSHTLRWSKQNQLLIHDGIWSYKIERLEGGKGYPRMTRTGPNGEVESQWDDSRGTGKVEFTSADGTTTIHQKVIKGPAKGKLESISRVYAGRAEPVTITRVTYDANGLMAAEVDALGRKTTHTYGLWGSNPRQGISKHVKIDPLGNSTSESYDRKGNLVSAVNAAGLISSFTYDNQNRRLTTSQSGPGVSPVVTESLTYTSAGAVASRADALGNITRFEYDARGNRVKTIDPLGNTTVDVFDQRNNRIKRTDALGHTRTYAYDEGGRLIKTTAPDGQVTETRSHNAQGKISCITDAAGNTSCTSYDVFGRVVSRTDALDRATLYSYEVKKGASGCAACNASAMPTTITLPSGRKIQRVYDADKHLIEETTAYGTQEAAVTKHEYDLAGNLIATTDALNRTSKFEYDAGNRRVKTVYPDSSTRIMAYDAAGQLIEDTNELGQVARRAYDIFGNMSSSTDAAGNVTATVFDSPAYAALHRPGGTKSPEGHITHISYDAVGNRIAQTLASGTPDEAVSRSTYDAVGNLIETTDAVGKVIKHVFDNRNRRITTTDPLGRTWSYRYTSNAGPSGNPPCCGADPAGNNLATETTFPDGSKESHTTDAAGQLIETKDAKGDAMKYTYDLDGRLETLTDARGSVTKWKYNAKGKLAGKVYPDKTTELYELDAAGQLVHRVRPDGTGVTHAYDQRGRLLSTVWDGGKAAPSHYEYDKTGRLTKAVNSSATIERSYSANGRLEEEKQIIAAISPEAPSPALQASVSYTYTADGRVASMVYPDGTEIGYSYTARGQLAEVSESPAAEKGKQNAAGAKQVATYKYRRDGKVSELAMANGIKTLKTYDAVGRLEKVLHLNPGGTELWSETSRYDQRDRRTARVHGDGQADLFAYDPAGQVTAAAYGQAAASLPAAPAIPNQGTENGKRETENVNWQQTFAYDPAGNRKAFQDTDGSTAEYQTNEANQYTTVKAGEAFQPAYDPNGNLLKDTHHTYTWDADIHLLSVETQSAIPNQPSQITKFAYDALYRRVARLETTTENGQPKTANVTYFVHDGWNVLQEHSSSPQAAVRPQKTFVWGHDISGSAQGAGGVAGLLEAHLSLNSQPITLHYHYDSNGNVMVLTDERGKEAARYSYDAFGKILNATGDAAQSNKYRFSTKPVEEACGLAFYGYRYYSPELGRWTARDPIGERGGFNYYAMVGNAPVGRVDNLGLRDCAQESIDCNRQCMENVSPWEDSDNSDAANYNARKRYCETECQRAYMECEDEEAARQKQTVAKCCAVAAGGYLIWTGVKWVVAVLAAPETGGLSLACAAATP